MPAHPDLGGLTDEQTAYVRNDYGEKAGDVAAVAMQKKPHAKVAKTAK